MWNRHICQSKTDGDWQVWRTHSGPIGRQHYRVTSDWLRWPISDKSCSPELVPKPVLTGSSPMACSWHTPVSSAPMCMGFVNRNFLHIMVAHFVKDVPSVGTNMLIKPLKRKTPFSKSEQWVQSTKTWRNLSDFIGTCQSCSQQEANGLQPPGTQRWDWWGGRWCEPDLLAHQQHPADSCPSRAEYKSVGHAWTGHQSSDPKPNELLAVYSLQRHLLSKTTS